MTCADNISAVQRVKSTLYTQGRKPRSARSAQCVLFCAVLYYEQIRRGAWFLHDLSGNALQLFLPCMIRLDCRHDVFHALGNARDRRDGELTNSPHIADNRRENLDSEICEGLRQQVGDAGYALTPQILKKRSRRSDGGQIVQELNAILEGKCWVRKAREEEMQYVQQHAVDEKVPMCHCWNETVKNPIKTGWADTNKGTSECPNIRSRSVQCHLWECRHLGSSVKQPGRVLPEGDGGGPGGRQCGLLRKSLWSTRDAAQNWECELGGFLEEIWGISFGPW